MLTPIVRLTALVIAISVAFIGGPGNALADPTETVISSFSGSDGAFPYAGLVMDKTGALYGTTHGGGSFGAGTVFELTPPAWAWWDPTNWTRTVLYSFGGPTNDGEQPNSLAMDMTGALYGTTYAGGSSGKGTVFKLTPPAWGDTEWTETVLYSFGGKPDGEEPYPYSGGLVMDKSGALYGTTAAGGSSGEGIVFKLTPPAWGHAAWTETVLYSFGGTLDDSAYPYAGLVMDKTGALYGTTVRGGSFDEGTVFKLTPPAWGHTKWTETVLYSFGGQPDGAAPYAGLLMDMSGALYGTTLAGGTDNIGTAFKLTPPAWGHGAWTETVLHSFGGQPDGAAPLYGGGLVMDMTGALYGTTVGGGTFNDGTVFELRPPAWGHGAWTETVLHSFGGQPDGYEPFAGLVMDMTGALYGTTVGGGTVNMGAVFKLTVPHLPFLEP